MYIRLFEHILDSSLMEADLEVRWLFVSMLIIGRPTKGIVDMPLSRLAAKAAMTAESTQHALDELMKPDPTSASPDEDGRRVVPLVLERPERGWRVVNWERYDVIFKKEHRQQQILEAVTRHREKKAGDKSVIKANQPVIIGNQGVIIPHSLDSSLPKGSLDSSFSSLFAEAIIAYRALAAEWRSPGLTDSKAAKLAGKFEKIHEELVAECDGFTWPECINRARVQPYIHESISSFDFEWLLKREQAGTRLNAQKVWNQQFAQRSQTSVPAAKEYHDFERYHRD